MVHKVSKDWIVQKFGGTSIGKYPLNVIENVIKPETHNHRVAVVCSALSPSNKEKGTTNRLLQAYRHCLEIDFERSNLLVQAVRDEHIETAYGYIKTPHLLSGLIHNIELECERVIQLLQATKTIGLGTPYILDKVISTGERLAGLFLSAALQDRNISSEIIDLSETVPPTFNGPMDHGFQDALASLIAKKINMCTATVPVVTGFFGPVHLGLLTQIGRGYTDFCAAMVAAGLQAEEFQVWKEVEGIFTADPSKVPGARMIPVISSEEASELTFHGSEVIHYAAMRLAMRAKVSMCIKNVLNPKAPGTLITDAWDTLCLSKKSSETVTQTPIAITSKDGVQMVKIRSTDRVKSHSFLAGIFSVFDQRNLSIDLISTSGAQVSIALQSEISPLADGDMRSSDIYQPHLDQAVAQLREQGDVQIIRNVTIITLVGTHLRKAFGLVGQIITTLGENRIKVEMIAHGASTASISCVVQEQDAGRAVALLHATFFTSPSLQTPCSETTFSIEA